MAETKRLLFVARQPPLPDDTGARIRSHRLLTALARRFPTTLITFAHLPGSGEHSLDPARLRAALADVEVVTVPGARASRRVRQLRGIASRRSWEWGRYASRDLRRAVAERAGPDVLVHLDDPGVAIAAEHAAPLTAFAPHNVEHRIVRDVSRAAGGVRRAFGALDWRRLEREERRLWRSATACVAVSEVDAAAMRAGGAKAVIVCPNGADPRPPVPPPWRGPGDPLRLLFVGSVSYKPYRDGLRWFIGEVLPLLEDLDPRFTVIGGRPRDALDRPGVEYVGRVAELDSWYGRAHVVVVPVFQGSGTRLKIPEAISYSRPVVSTTLGAEGLPLRGGEHYLAADDPAAFAAALRDLAARLAARDPSVARLLEDGRTACAPLEWPRLGEALADVYADLPRTVATIRSTRSSSR